jgi:hypothetical protein
MKTSKTIKDASVEWDEANRCLYVNLRPELIHSTRTRSTPHAEVIIDTDADGTLVGVEVIGL